MINPATSKASIDKNHQSIGKDPSARQRIMATTMSVDEYFDELINQVRKDYANPS